MDQHVNGWMKSPILLRHWKDLKSEHHPNVQKFIDVILIQQNPYLRAPLKIQ